ncbi:hypothetical protein [Borreliella burgdorferi]
MIDHNKYDDLNQIIKNIDKPNILFYHS